MTTHPIIFSSPMVRALLDGRKTQTRRVLKPQPEWSERNGTLAAGWSWGPLARWDDDQEFAEKLVTRLPQKVGHRLWVQEACRITSAGDDGEPHYNPPVSYIADDHDYDGNHPFYYSDEEMPRWASRLTLTVTDMRVQRLQDISAADAMAEGITAYAEGFAADGLFWGPTPPKSFEYLWNSLHGPEAWDANPWVAAYTFTVQRANIDKGEG